ncbi:response regulator transcription factor [Clostridium butyricum]|uniref:response regulator transcription factor n=1 Tax=Clostridium butyricum TaxID=1492 RepID=UPI00136C71DB|nr:response regulator transcription factor [Clostridium butyricum]MZI83049.1 response regulator [Clostridium butyricum]
MKDIKRIIIIDDDKELCNLLKKCLENDNYVISTAHSGIEGLKMVRKGKYHLIILDVMLPQLSGLTVLKEIRQCMNTPVLMLSAKDQELDKVLGLKSGADDYLTKPFGLSELIARVDSLIRRFMTLGGQDTTINELIYGNINIDLIKRIVIKNGNEVILTAKEFELISFLASNPEHVFSKKQIYQQVWQEDYIYNDNNIMALIRRVRKKIEDDPENPVLIQTAWGVGYRFHWEGN